ncbi:adenine-specific DNA-methyltransferase [Caloramator fervidus]|uniref:site-specific DNA-methyltransferase (adenine-specific) n=1 Tax=Caloramator fervidus TaxID=29344 RepID=A0A1H5SXB1_9CLOT|nr:N-6 DNA methylase [Caloramator fervidus]SEF55223.1 adenine-specific DNA-methyltransferase [Caloramator fervidus]
MLKEFLKDLNDAYNKLLNGEEDLYIFQKWGSLGEAYQNLTKKEDKKRSGSVYTPFEIVKYMIDTSINFEDYKKNPFIKILDPSCGGGFFLIYVYQKLLDYAKILNIENPQEHIIKNNIYGIDLDDSAVKITILELFKLSKIVSKNILNKDFLFELKDKFDVIIGNPPYMGHKMLEHGYREKLKSYYSDVFYNKGDLSYCFIKKSIDLLNNNGRLVFFTSRYLLEAQNSEGIRNYIIKNASLEKIVDFYGVRVFKNVGVDNIILYVLKDNKKEVEYFKVLPNVKANINEIFDDVNNRLNVFTKRVTVLKNELEEGGWNFLNSLEKNIINKITGIRLGEIAKCYQGVITGCDKAFVLTYEEAERLKIEKNLLKPFIKSSEVERFKVRKGNRVLIYSNLIDDYGKYLYALNHIGKFKDKLLKRRECKKGIRKWYELQWGRSLELFESKKIIFPYKSSNNRFAIDKGNFFSADVYALKLFGLYESLYSYEFLVGVLNSSIYEFYLKTLLKKLGDNLYEYYPYNLLKIRIPEYIKEIEMEVLKEKEVNVKVIDEILIDKFKITKKEFEQVKFWVRH